jgi:predicted hydrocarbon binding protein
MAIDIVEKNDAVDLVTGAHHHNYYTPDDFFRIDGETGAIYLHDGQRAARIDEAFINGLHLGAAEEAGDAGGLLMYRCGYRWGIEDMKRFNDRMRQEFGGGKRDIWQMNTRFVLETWWWPLTITGFGGWSLDFSFRERDITVVEICNSAVAQSIDMTGKPVCHLYAGLLAGVFSFFERKERQAIEIQCYAMGNDTCKFLIGNQEQVNAVDFRVKKGSPAAEIIASFE